MLQLRDIIALKNALIISHLTDSKIHSYSKDTSKSRVLCTCINVCISTSQYVHAGIHIIREDANT